MKIQCKKCHTLFLIDDSLISDKGVKAQCPRCGEQTVVKKHSQQASDLLGDMGDNLNLGGFSSSPMSTGLGGDYFSSSPETRTPFSDDNSLFSGLGSGLEGPESPSSTAEDSVSCFKCGRPVPPDRVDSLLPICDYCRSESSEGSFSPESPGPSDFLPYGDMKGGFDDVGLSAGLDTFSPPPTADESKETGGDLSSLVPDLPERGDSLGGPLADSSEKSDLSLGDSERFEDEKLDLSDLDDQISIPLLEESAESEALAEEEGENRAESGVKFDPNWIKIRKISDGKELGPISLREVRSLYTQGKISLEDEYCGRDGEWMPISEVPELLKILQSIPQISGEKKEKERGKFLYFILGGAFILTLSLVGGFFIASFSLNKGSGGKGTTKLAQTDKGDEKSETFSVKSESNYSSSSLFTNKLKEWRALYPKFKPNRKRLREYIRRGMSEFFRDNEQNYFKASELFVYSMLIDPYRRESFAYYALSRLWGSMESFPPQPLPLAELRELTEILRYFDEKYPSPAITAAYSYLLARQGEPEKAVQKLQLVVNKHPKSALPFGVLGEIFYKLRDNPQVAEKYFEKAIKIKSNFQRVRYFLAEINLEKKRFYRCERYLSTLIKRGHRKGLYLAADFYITLGRYGLAKQYLSKLVKREPDNYKAALRLAVLQYQLLHAPNSSYLLLKKLLRKKIPKNIKKIVKLHYGFVNMELKKYKRARSIAESLAKENSSFLPAVFLLAQLDIFDRDYPSAHRRLNRLYSRLSDSKFLLLRGIAFEESGNLKGALKLYRELSLQESFNIWPKLLLAALLIKEKSVRKGLLVIAKSLDVEPDLMAFQKKSTLFFISNRFWYNLSDRFVKFRIRNPQGARAITISAGGIVLYQIGDKKKAASLFHRALRIDSLCIPANIYLAQIYYELSLYNRAEKYAMKIFQQYPQYYVSAQILGWISYQRGAEKRAEEFFSQVLKNRPWYIGSRIGKALILIKKKEYKKVESILARLRDSHTYHRLFFRALYNLEKSRARRASL